MTSRSFTAKRAVILHRIGGAWEKQPSKKLGELIHEALRVQSIMPEELLTIDDERLVLLLERYVLFGEEKPTS